MPMTKHQADNARRARRLQERDAIGAAFRAASRLTFGPCECAPGEAEEILTVADGYFSTKIIPVIHIATQNRAILERCA